MKLMMLCTDWLVLLLAICFSFWIYRFRKMNEWGLVWNKLYSHPKYLVALMVLMLYLVIGLLDCFHLEENKINEVRSILDILLISRATQNETTYSAPFATQSFTPQVLNFGGKIQQSYSSLNYAGQYIQKYNIAKSKDIAFRLLIGVLLGLTLTGLFYFTLHYLWPNVLEKPLFKKQGRTFWTTLSFISCLIAMIALLVNEYHIFGTDKIGRDVFYIAIKSIRTGLIIGTVTTLVMLPFALLLGMWAGYFRGAVDDCIQYIYTTLSSVPSVLLIAAAMLSFQLKITEDPDLRLLILCVVLGVTSWTTLCRLLRGETLKLRELDYVQSAVALGVTQFKIIRRHIMPNLMHIVIISVALDFSALVLAEAILSYVGVGVDPTSFSWGNLINASRLELAREPIVWWPLSGALLLMFVLVFCANILSDALQEALNPKAG